MNISYKPTRDDFSNLQMFACRHTPKIYKQYVAQNYIGRFIFLALSIISLSRYTTTHSVLQLVMLGISVVLFILYPRFNFWIYKKTINKKFKAIDKERGDGIIHLSIDAEKLELTDNRGQYTMKTSDIMQMYEVGEYFFIQMHNSTFLSIPKAQVKDTEVIRTELHEYASTYKISYIQKLDWVSDLYSKKSKMF